MNWLADLVLAIHVAFILFVVGGQILILAGWALGWSWPQHRWFRLLHLLAIGFVMLQAWIGVICPLTTLENFFRDAAGVATYENGFIRYWVRELVFYAAPGWVFTLVYTVFAGLVALTWFAYPPRRKL
jgi:polyferredoxin